MAESAACLVRSFTQPSPTSEGEKMNHLHRALTTSVSFGRFMSESLDWVKWSAFTQNRYLEEVEKYSKPGSVAEKKAYFEAHFKRRRAAALLEQQNAVSDASATDPFTENVENSVKGDDGSSNLKLPQRDGNVVHKIAKEEEVQNCCTVNLVNQSVLSTAEVMVKTTQPGGVEISTDAQAFVESKVGQTNSLENNDKPKSEDQDYKKDNSSKGNPALSSEVSSVFLINDGASKSLPSPPVKLLPVQLKNGEKTPNNNDNMKDSGSKRRSYTTSLQVPINLASCLVQTHKATTPVHQRIASNSVHRGPAKKFRNSTRSQTKTTEEATNGIFKQNLKTTTEKESRTQTITGTSLLRSRMLDGKLQSSSMTCSKSSTAFGSKARLPTVACPFTFKSEERAAKRKEKLEQKLKSNDTEKQRSLVKPQIKSRKSIKQVHNSIATEATKNPEISVPLCTTDLSTNLTNKSIPTLRPRNPKLEERASFKVLDDNSRRPWGKVMGETNDVKNKHRATTINRVWKRNMNENASPNIQL